jgi:hypothetical protein
MRPHHVTKYPNFLLSIEFRPQVHKVQERPETEAHYEVLPVIEGQDTPSMLFGIPCHDQFAVTVCGFGADNQVFIPLMVVVKVFFTLSVGVIPSRTEVKYFFEGFDTISRIDDALSGIPHTLRIKTYGNSVRTGLLQYGVREIPTVKRDGRVLQGSVVPPFPHQKPFHTDFPRPGLIRPGSPIVVDKPFTVVLVHACVVALLGVWRGGQGFYSEEGIGQVHGNWYFPSIIPG